MSLVLWLTLAGCTAGATEISTPSNVAGPSNVAEASDVADPITYPSDNMWAFLSSAAEGSRRADTLEAAVEFAEVVVVGRYVGVERGDLYGSDATAVALIEVDSVAKGKPKLGSDGRLRVEFVLVVGGGSYPDKELSDLQRSIPSEPALLYLFSWASYLELIGGGFPEFEARSDLESIYKTIGGDGAMRVVQGKIAPSSVVEGWPTALRGVDLETVLERIRAVKP